MKQMSLKASNKRIVSFLLVGGLLLLSFLIAYIFDTEILRLAGFDAEEDVFMDFFNSVRHAMGGDPYNKSGIYPPLCYVIYWAMGILMNNKTAAPILLGEASALGLRGLLGPMLVYLFYFSVTLVLFMKLMRVICDKMSSVKCTVMIFLICFSLPFSFQFGRANIIFLGLLGTLAFFCWKDSENKYLREVAYICLALSAAVKIYPAIFGLFLVAEKKWKAAIRTVIYGVIAFFGPFLAIKGGLKNILLLIDNMLFATNDTMVEDIGYRINFAAILERLFGEFAYINVIVFLLSGLCVISFFVAKSEWKKMLALTSLLVGFPKMSFLYVGIFLVIPLLFFLQSDKKEKMDWVYFFFFVIIFFPLPLIGKYARIEAAAEYYKKSMSFYTVQVAAGIFLMTIVLVIETFWKNFFLKKST